jgi:hypothetical protein
MNSIENKIILRKIDSLYEESVIKYIILVTWIGDKIHNLLVI